jgi:hypothetical protein
MCPRVLLTVLFIALSTLPARAQPYAEPTARDIVVAYNVGPRFSIAPGIIIPSGNQRIGFSIAADFRYGIELGPVILAPGARLGGYFPSGSFGLLGLGTLRLTVPLGPVAPYALAGLGPGYLSEPAHTGLAHLAGGGLMIHIGRSFAIGAEASYLAITGSDFRTLFIGPTLLLGF